MGQAAPDFTLKSQESTPVSLHDFRGKWVVLYFYPRNLASGCTLKAHNFQCDLLRYEIKNAVILAVSVQQSDSHKDFCAKEVLSLKVLADANDEVSSTYDSTMNLFVTKLSAMHTFLINPKGIVAKEFLDVNPSTHSDEVLAALMQLEK